MNSNVRKEMKEILDNYKEYYSLKHVSPYGLESFKEKYEQPSPDSMNQLAEERSRLKNITHQLYESIISALPNEEAYRRGFYKNRIKDEVQNLIETYEKIRSLISNQQIYNLLACAIKDMTYDMPLETTTLYAKIGSKGKTYNRRVIRSNVNNPNIGKGQIFSLSRVKSLKSIFEKTAKGRRITDILGLKFIFDLEENTEKHLNYLASYIHSIYKEIGFVPFSKTSIYTTHGFETYAFFAEDRERQYLNVYIPKNKRYLIRAELRRNPNVLITQSGNTVIISQIQGKNISEGKQKVKELQKRAENRVIRDHLQTPEVRTKEILVPIWEEFFKEGMHRYFLDETTFKRTITHVLKLSDEDLRTEKFGIREYTLKNKKKNGYCGININYGLFSFDEEYSIGGIIIVPVIPLLEVQATTLMHHINNELGTASHDEIYKKETIIDYYTKLFWEACGACEHLKGKKITERRKRKALNSLESTFKKLLTQISRKKYDTTFFPN